MSAKNPRKAYAYGLSAALLWSTVATAFKLALEHLEPVQLLFVASSVSLLVLGAIAAVTGKLGAVRASTRREWLLSLGLGLLNPFLYYLILFEAYDRLPAQEAQPLNYTWPIALALLSIPLLKQRIGGRDLGAAGICYAGVLVISTRGELLDFELSDPAGVGLALLSTLVWALYWIANTRDRRDPVVGLFLASLCGWPFVLGACLLLSDLELNTAGVLSAAYVGLFEMGLTFVLWLHALKQATNTARVGNLAFVSPFVSLVFIHFVLGEELLPSTFVGLGLIVAGLIVQQTGQAPDDGT